MAAWEKFSRPPFFLRARRPEARCATCDPKRNNRVERAGTAFGAGQDSDDPIRHSMDRHATDAIPGPFANND
jgi:hypothetical protein